MNKILGTFLTILLTTSCNQTPKEETVTGVLLDASINNIVILTTENDTLAISTIELNDSGKMVSVIIGDSIDVNYKTVNNKTLSHNTATKVSIIHYPLESRVIGEWVEPIPIATDQVQGINIMPHGKATSINMATLVMEQWQIDGNSIELISKSIGNGMEFQDTTLYNIIKSTQDSLILGKNGNIIWQLGRRK